MVVHTYYKTILLDYLIDLQLIKQELEQHE
jgi:hypothetical protein